MYYGPSRLLVVTLLQHLMEWLSWSVVILSTSNITLTPPHQAAFWPSPVTSRSRQRYSSRTFPRASQGSLFVPTRAAAGNPTAHPLTAINLFCLTLSSNCL